MTTFAPASVLTLNRYRSYLQIKSLVSCAELLVEGKRANFPHPTDNNSPHNTRFGHGVLDRNLGMQRSLDPQPLKPIPGGSDLLTIRLRKIFAHRLLETGSQ